jgi:hypothetical protein
MKNKYPLALTFVLTCLFMSAGCVAREYSVTESYNEPQSNTEYTTSTYTDNETASRTDSGDFSLTSYFNWSSSDLSVGGSPYLYYYGYEIPDASTYDDIHLRISLWEQLQYEPAVMRAFDVSKPGHLQPPGASLEDSVPLQPPDWYTITGKAPEFWLQSANVWVNQSRFLGATNYLWSKSANPQVIELDAGKASRVAIILSGPQNRWNCRATVDVVWSRNSVEYTPVIRERQIPRQVITQVQKQRTVRTVRQVPFWEAIFSP